MGCLTDVKHLHRKSTLPQSSHRYWPKLLLLENCSNTNLKETEVPSTLDCTRELTRSPALSADMRYPFRNTNLSFEHNTGHTEVQATPARNCQADIITFLYYFQQNDELFDEINPAIVQSFILNLHLSMYGYRSDLSTWQEVWLLSEMHLWLCTVGSRSQALSSFLFVIVLTAPCN